MPLLSNGASRMLGGRVQAAWTPASLPGLALWVDFADISTLYQDTAGTTPVTADGQAIARARSKAAAASIFTQGTAGAQPKYKTGRVNGRSTALFDGGDVLDNTTFVMDLRYRTVFVVARENTAVDNAGLVTIKPALGNDYERTDGVIYGTGVAARNFEASGSTGISYQLYVSGAGATPLAIYCERKTTGRGDLYAGGGAAAATGATFTEFANASGGGAVLGGRYIGSAIPAGYRLNGDICEVIIYSSKLSAADTNKVGAYLAAKWGLTWANIS